MRQLEPKDLKASRAEGLEFEPTLEPLGGVGVLEPIEPKGRRRLEPIEPKGRRQKLALHGEHTRNTQTHASHKHVRMELGLWVGLWESRDSKSKED